MVLEAADASIDVPTAIINNVRIKNERDAPWSLDITMVSLFVVFRIGHCFLYAKILYNLQH